jgi:hypothetical protein
MTNKMKEFLDKVDKICYEYRYEIKPTYPVPDDENTKKPSKVKPKIEIEKE